MSCRSCKLVDQLTKTSFEKHIDETIAKHPKEASVGGLPGVTNKIRAYVDVLNKAKGLETFKPEVGA